MEMMMSAQFSETQIGRFGLPRITIGKVVQYFLNANQRYQQMRDLEKLNDEALRDIGISRADVGDELHRMRHWWVLTGARN